LANQIVRSHNDLLDKTAIENDTKDIHFTDKQLAAELAGKNDMKMTMTTIRLQPNQLRVLNQLAKKQEVSMSKLVRYAIEKSFAALLARFDNQ
jgi:hypothetical protein